MNLNVKPRTIFCHDNLGVLQGINPQCIDLIYLDPPFNKKKVFTAPLGSAAAGASFSDIFRKEDIKAEWVHSIATENNELHNLLVGIQSFSNEYNYCYCVYMAIRLMECRRILRPAGSLYLHCDPTMSHYLKLVMDCVFGERHFRNEIIWGYRTGGVSKRYFPRKHDIILHYGKSGRTFHRPLKETILYDRPFFTNSAPDSSGKYPVEVYVRDVWDDEIKPVINVSKQRTGYPTQKPLELLERIISASSEAGGMVLDPFCGCATTCIAAERLGRQWIGVDVSIEAYEQVKDRLQKEVPQDMLRAEPNFSTEPPAMTERPADLGYVYIMSNAALPGMLKVGISKNPEARARSIMSQAPAETVLEWKFKTPHYRAIERQIHATWPRRKEWVQTDDINALKAAIKGYKPAP